MSMQVTVLPGHNVTWTTPSANNNLPLIYTGGETLTVDNITGASWISAGLVSEYIPYTNLRVNTITDSTGQTLQGFIDGAGNFYPLLKTTIASLATGTANATSNTATIQSIVNSGGHIRIINPGVYYVNATITLGSNTTIEITEGVELRQSASVPFPFFINANPFPTLHAVSSITWAWQDTVNQPHTAIATVTYTSDVPDVVPGQYVMIDGDPNFINNGSHIVDTVSGQNITFKVGSIALQYTNPTVSMAAASFTGTVTGGNTLTISSITGTVQLNSPIKGAGIPSGTIIIGVNGTGTGGNGTYAINNNLNIPSGIAMTTLPTQITISKADNDIAVTGKGRLNGNFSGRGNITANLSYLDHGIFLSNVVRPFVGAGENGYLQIDDLAQYCVCIGRCDSPKAIGVYSNYNPKDGVHYFGPIFGYPEIRKLGGYYGDDAAIFENAPNTVYNPYLPYAVFNGVNVYGGSFYEGGLIDDINVTVNGNAATAVMYPSSSQGASSGNGAVGSTAYKMFGKFNISNIGHKSPAAGLTGSNTFSIGGSYNYDIGYIDDIYVDSIRGGMFLGGANAGTLINVNKIDVKNWSNLNFEDYMYMPGTTYLNAISLSLDCDYNSSSTIDVFNLGAGTVIQKLKMSGNFNSNNGVIIVLSSYGATVNTILLSDITMQGTNNQGLINTTNFTFTNTPTIILDNINSEVNQAFQVSTAQSMNIIAKGISQTGYGAFFSLYGTGTINLDVSGVIPYLGNFSLFGSAYPGCSFTNISNYTPPVHAAPASGTVTLINNMGYQRLILSPTGAFTLSWPNPTNGPTNGEIVELMFATGGFTVTNTSGTVLGMPAAPGAGFGGSFIYDATTTKWLYRG